MKFIIDAQALEFFKNHGVIELEGLFNELKLNDLNNCIQEVFSRRLKNVTDVDSELLFREGIDLWRENEGIVKILNSSHIPAIAKELVGKTLRQGYDLFLPGKSTPRGQYFKFLSQKMSLQEFCCIQGAVCGFLLPLEKVEDMEPKEGSFLATKIGNGVFFNENVPLDLSQMENPYLMVVYAKISSLYIYKENDPHPHNLKKWGYNFGDRLKNTLNPIVAR